MSANAGRYTALAAVAPSASVTVRNHGTPTLATLYSTKTGTTTVANPLAANQRGDFTFFAAYGSYDLLLPSEDFITTVTVTIRPDPANVWPG